MQFIRCNPWECSLVFLSFFNFFLFLILHSFNTFFLLSFQFLFFIILRLSLLPRNGAITKLDPSNLHRTDEILLEESDGPDDCFSDSETAKYKTGISLLQRQKSKKSNLDVNSQSSDSECVLTPVKSLEDASTLKTSGTPFKDRSLFMTMTSLLSFVVKLSHI